MESQLEQLLMSSYKVDMIAFMDTHPAAFNEAAKLAVSDKQPHAWRAASLLWSCMKENDPRIKKHTGKIIAYLPVAQDNQKRELLKILSRVELDDEQESRVFETCLELWEDITKVPSIRHTAFVMLLNSARKYPELLYEITLLTQEHYLSTLSPGVRNSIGKLLKTVRK